MKYLCLGYRRERVAVAAATLRWSGDHVAVTEGPAADAPLDAVMLLEATDLNHAIALLSRQSAMRACDHVEVRPLARDTQLLERPS